MYICIYELAREREEAKSIRRPRRVAYVFSSFSLSLSWSREETRALSAKVSPMMNSRTGTKRNSDQSTRERERESPGAPEGETQKLFLYRKRESRFMKLIGERKREREMPLPNVLSLSLCTVIAHYPHFCSPLASLSLSLSLFAF